MTADTREAKLALAEALEAAVRQFTYQGRVLTFAPYDKQLTHLALGSSRRERLLMANNRAGKSETGAFEAACHMTGRYPGPGQIFYPDTPEMRLAGLVGKDAFPQGWQGRRFDGPTKGWIAGVTSLDVRNVCQTKLCGQYGVEAAFGSGMIPKEDLVDVSLARGVTDAYDTIQVKHVAGGISTAQFKSYEQGRQKFQGEGLDWIWFDEEPPLDVYSEGLTRIGERDGIAWLTFTPLNGRSDVVIRYLDEPSDDRIVTTITLDESVHILPVTRTRMIAGYLAHEREARARGVPMLGSGRIFMAPEESIIEAPLQHIPDYWVKIWGIDFGIGHPFAAVLLLWDRDNDVIHVHHTYRVADALPLQHASAMKQVGAAVPVAYPKDGGDREKGSGEPLADLYGKQSLVMLHEHATWPDGSVSTEAGIVEMDAREKSGRLKVAAHLSDYLEERRFYHRKDGQIVKIKDDILSACRIGIMMKRFARAVQLGGRIASRRPGAEPQMARDVDFPLF